MNKRFVTHYQGNKEGPITYIMMHSFRMHYNHGLEEALALREETSQELIIVVYRHKEENQRNNEFFQEGMKEFSGFLGKITSHIYYVEDIDKTLLNAIRISSVVIKDHSYLKEHKDIETKLLQVAKTYDTSFITVESNVLVPVLVASDKEEYGARTIRPKIHKQISNFIDFEDQAGPYFFYEQQAKDILEEFIQYKLPHYDERNEPSKDYTSLLSPYLKYGFISPLYIYLKVMASDHPNKDLFIEELIIRRELSYNFIEYNKKYYDFDHMTYGWAYDTMNVHSQDEREYIYKVEDYINFKTHDPYFNAAMKEMVYLGRMHGYMRMYWAKKIIEWSATYREAYQIAIYLNNYYFLDGNDPNGYTGVAWCFGKHDRAWTERPIFGKLRYMNSNGLKRKFDIEAYVEKINHLTGE